MDQLLQDPALARLVNDLERDWAANIVALNPPLPSLPPKQEARDHVKDEPMETIADVSTSQMEDGITFDLYSQYTKIVVDNPRKAEVCQFLVAPPMSPSDPGYSSMSDDEDLLVPVPSTRHRYPK